MKGRKERKTEDPISQLATFQRYTFLAGHASSKTQLHSLNMPNTQTYKPTQSIHPSKKNWIFHRFTDNTRTKIRATTHHSSSNMHHVPFHPYFPFQRKDHILTRPQIFNAYPRTLPLHSFSSTTSSNRSHFPDLHKCLNSPFQIPDGYQCLTKKKYTNN